MAGLVPFNHRNNKMVNSGFNFYNMLDDFFGDNWLESRSLFRDSFKVDIKEEDKEYIIEAELPGVNKEQINLDVDQENLCISVNHLEERKEERENYIHKERRTSSMARRIRLVDSDLDNIKAKLENGLLLIKVPKKKISTTKRIEIE